jgi:UDP-N-acetylmuramoylalanine--D-glutamate ligase
LIDAATAAGLELVSDLQLGLNHASCLSIVIAGASGKSTTAQLIEHLLISNHRKVLPCGGDAQPVCRAASASREADFILVEASPAQLVRAPRFKPSVAVLTNLSLELIEGFKREADYVRAHASMFIQQQAFDWAIVQSEALARLREFGCDVPSKLITFSAADPEADLRLDRGLLISKMPTWSGPLLDIDQCRLTGAHNAENLMAALAVGHVLRLSLEDMAPPLKSFAPGPHRFGLVAEIRGVQFINDAKCSNLESLQKSIAATRPGEGGNANVWLIAGGAETDLAFHDAGPVLSQRVKHACLFGPAAERIRSAWALFTPCTVANSLVEAVTGAAKRAASGDVILLSPACSSPDQFRDYVEIGELFCETVKSIARGARTGTHNIT